MQQDARIFADRLNKCLDEMDVPSMPRERAAILSKMLHIPKQIAWSLIEGHQLPDQELLQSMASEFEVEPHWLLGERK